MTSHNVGAIIIWNDVTQDGRDDFYEWHLNEHIPERLAIPGFLRGSRYIALSAETRPEFLTLYETVDAAVATSKPYLARLNAPTPWTKRATAHFRNTSRALTRTILSSGCGMGGIIGTLRFDGSDSGQEFFRRVEQHRDTLVAISRLPRISSVRLCMTDIAASGAKSVESHDRADILAAPIGAVLIEGCDAGAVSAALTNVAFKLGAISGAEYTGIYRLEHQLIAKWM
jgi:hypothetical protein